MIENLKTCRTCGEEKPLLDYPKSPKSIGGHSRKCKKCVYAYNKDRSRKLRGETPREKTKRLLALGIKECLGCKETKPLIAFWHNSRFGGYRAYCKPCNKLQWSEWKDGRKEHLRIYSEQYHARPDVKERKSETKKRYAAASPRSVLQITLRHGLRRRPTENPATIDDVMRKFHDQGGLCAVTGIKMTWGRGTVLPTSISIDRIDHMGGYSADNLRLICHCVNAFKGRMTDNEMQEFAGRILAPVALLPEHSILSLPS